MIEAYICDAVMTAVRGLRETGAQRALVTMCVGVGQGLALAVERV